MSFTAFYTLEMVLKILGLGFVLNRGSYIRDPWNVLDFVIVVSSYLPLFIGSGSSINVSGLRSLRVLRPLKTVTAIRKLRALIITIFAAIPYLIEIAVVLIFVFLIFAIVGLQLYLGGLRSKCYDGPSGRPYVDDSGNFVICGGAECPSIPPSGGGFVYTELVCGAFGMNPDYGVSSFDDISSAFLNVYIVTTLEGWTSLMGYVQQSMNSLFFIYFVVIVFICAFILINLTQAVVTIKFNEIQDTTKQEEQLRLKNINDDYFVILPRLSWQQVKPPEGVSLLRMRANTEFDLSTIAKYDTVTEMQLGKNPFFKDPRPPVEHPRGPSNTFDNLWDWRLTQGEAFVGREMKSIIRVYHHNDGPARRVKPIAMGRKSVNPTEKSSRPDAGLVDENKSVGRLDTFGGVAKKSVYFADEPSQDRYSPINFAAVSTPGLMDNMTQSPFQELDGIRFPDQVKLSRFAPGGTPGIQIQPFPSILKNSAEKQRPELALADIQATPELVSSSRLITLQKVAPEPQKTPSGPIEPPLPTQTASVMALDFSKLGRSSPTDSRRSRVQPMRSSNLASSQLGRSAAKRDRTKAAPSQDDSDEVRSVDELALEALQQQAAQEDVDHPQSQRNRGLESIKNLLAPEELEKEDEEDEDEEEIGVKADDGPEKPVTAAKTANVPQSALSVEQQTEMTKSALQIEEEKQIEKQKKAERTETKKQVKELLDMAGLTTEDIVKKYGKKTKKKLESQAEEQEIRKKQETLQKVEEKYAPRRLFQEKKISLWDERLVRKRPVNREAGAAALTADRSEDWTEQDFQISDEEEANKALEALMKEQQINRGDIQRVTKYMASQVRTVREIKLKKHKAYFEDIKQDEDFRTVGDVKLNEPLSKLPNGLEKLKIPLPKINSHHDKQGSDSKPKQQLLSEERGLLTTGRTLNNKGGEENPQFQTIDPQNKNVDQPKAKDAKGNNSTTEVKENLQGGDNPEGKDKMAGQDAEDHNQTLDASAMPLKDGVGEDGKKPLSIMEKLAQQKLEKELEEEKKKALKNKKKKKEEEDQKTPEQEEEEQIVKYYQKNKYVNLKLEANFQYHLIPPPAFTSVWDVVPTLIEKKANSKLKDTVGDPATTALKLVYTAEGSSTKKNAKKKKPKQRKEGSDGEGSKAKGLSSESDAFSLSEGGSEDDFGLGNHTRRGSQAKQERHAWLEQNDRYINRKPFPLKESKRKESILLDMAGGGKGSKQKDSQSVTTSASKRGDRAKVNDFQADFGIVADKYAKDEQELEKDVEELQTEAAMHDYRILYSTIKTQDMQEKEIAKYNWSGRQVMSGRNFSQSQTEKTVYALNSQKLDIWLVGCNGAVYTLRRYVREVVDGPTVNFILLASVFLNTLVMALDGLLPDSISFEVQVVNLIFTSVFILELIFKLIGYGIRNYCKDAFNVFDAFVVSLSLVELAINFTSYSSPFVPDNAGKGGASALRAVRIFRIFRVLRVSRLLRKLHFMKVIIQVIKGTAEQFAYIALLMFLFVFIFALLGTQVFGGTYQFMKSPTDVRWGFNSFQSAFFTSFIILTLENWNSLLYDHLRTTVSPPLTAIFFIVWIFIGNYIFLNLFLAILLDGFESSDALQEVEEIEEEHKELEYIHSRLLEDLKTKQARESSEKLESEKKVNMIIEPDKYAEEEQIKKRSSCYYIVRNNDEDHQSLSDHLDLKKNIDASFNTNQTKPDPFEGVTCYKTFYYFKKSHWFRKFCARVCSHPKFETVVLVLIILSSIKLVVGTYYREDVLEVSNPLLFKIQNYIDVVFNVAFTIESILKIMRNGFVVADTSYLRDSWSILDFIIVTTSLIDMSLESVNLPILKVIRLLRTLRPLRFISQNQNMRIVVNGLLKSMVAILNVLIVIGMVFVMFAILGNNLMGGKMKYCQVASDPGFSPYSISETACTTLYNGTMKNYPANFDDIGQSMVTLFILTTMEGWPDILGAAMDANDPDSGPEFMGSATNGLFFIVFILVGSLFLMNMFVGVIFVQFTEEQRLEKQKRFYMVTDDQMRWMMVQDITVTAEPNFDVMLRPKGKFRIWVFKFIHSKTFELVIMTFIILNIATMAMNYEFMSTSYIDMLNNVNLGFTAVFTMEFIIKVVALDFQYFTTSWNIFDFSIVMLSLVDILVSQIGSGKSDNPILTQAPQIAKMLRVLRVSRLFKLMKAKQLKGINKIVKTIVFSFPSLMNVMVLLLLVYFIFSVLAVFLFSGTVPRDDSFNNDLFNFDNFHMAMITLFRCSTGENWPQFMFYYGETGSWSDSLKSRFFFVFFIFLSYTVMLQVFQLVVMQQFDEYYFNSDNPINSFDEAEEVFRKTWNQFTIKTRGAKIKASRMVQFFYYLE